MSLYGSGLNNTRALGIDSNSQSEDGHGIVSQFMKIPVNAADLLCISPGSCHSILITMDGKVLASGDDVEFRIGSDKREVFFDFTEIKICDEKTRWAACGGDFTLYLTASCKVILCHSKAQGEKIEISFPNRAISVFSGYSYGGIIDEEGSIYLLDKEDPRKAPSQIAVPSPAIELACLDACCFALLQDGSFLQIAKVDEDNYGVTDLSSDLIISKISGYGNTLLILTSDGAVYAYGTNEFGQFGDGTTDDDWTMFKPISALGDLKIKDISSSFHSLLITSCDELYGCGCNNFHQLGCEHEQVLYPMKLADKKITKAFAGECFTFIVEDFQMIENPARLYFLNQIDYQKYFH